MLNSIDEIMENLTPEQQLAAAHMDGPAFILAVPGSGKTRTLTHRIAYLLAKEVDPATILAITFTNKAAGEMKSRVKHMVGDELAKRLRISTFHSFCAKTLRADGAGFGVKSNFTILDADESKQLMAECISRKLGVPKSEVFKRDDPLNVRNVITVVSGWKINCWLPHHLENVGFEFSYLRGILDIYSEYQRTLKKNNCVDFDDLLLYVTLGFSESESLRTSYSKFYKYIMVDEYQDTNPIQYQLVKYLDSHHKNMYVVGDIDQAIYGWNGATIENIDKLRKEYKGIKMYTLEKNFRSYQSIVDVANNVIVHNDNRIEKTIRAVKTGGEKPRCIKCYDGRSEAMFIATEIRAMVKGGYASYKDFCVVYRLNAKSRPVEDACVRLGIPYRVVGALPFYKRKVVKDLLAYLALYVNPKDDIAFGRIYNTPRRGIGYESFSMMADVAYRRKKSLSKCSRKGIFNNYISSRAVTGLQKFIKIFTSVDKKTAQTSVGPVVRHMAHQSGYISSIETEMQRCKKADTKKMELLNDKLDLINEFITAADEFDKNSKGQGVFDFLEWVALLQSEDEKDKEDRNQVLLMSCHAAKGLEFPHVYLIQCNNGVIPCIRANQTGGSKGQVREMISNGKKKKGGKDKSGGLDRLLDRQLASSKQEREEYEEERRIFYVATTRAEEKLTISHVSIQSHYNKTFPANPSPFIYEAGESLDHIDNTY